MENPLENHLMEHDRERNMLFRLNRTGNIYYSSSEMVLKQDARELFDIVTVIFAAMTKALARANKSLSDNKAWNELIRSSGFFVQMQEYSQNLTVASGSNTINTQLVSQILPGIQQGSSMKIAQGVLSSIGTEFKDVADKSNFSHTIFYCEDIMGAPSVVVRIIKITEDFMKKIDETPCSSSTITTFSQEITGDTYLFVSPDSLKQHASSFVNVPEEFNTLVSELYDRIKSAN